MDLASLQNRYFRVLLQQRVGKTAGQRQRTDGKNEWIGSAGRRLVGVQDIGENDRQPAIWEQILLTVGLYLRRAVYRVKKLNRLV